MNPRSGLNQTEIRELNGRPGLFRNGKPLSALFFWESYPQAWETSQFSQRGLKLFSAFRTSQHYDHEWWREDGSIDFDFFDDGIRAFLANSRTSNGEVNSETLFLPRVFYTAPGWWVKKNPEELTVYGSGRTTTPRESFASLKFRKEAGDAWRKVIRHILDADYAEHILGIHVASGPWGEHFYWDAYFHGKQSVPQGSDVSRPMQEAFRTFLKEKYSNNLSLLREALCDPQAEFELIRVPSLEQRLATNGAWRDPAKGRLVLDYWECHFRQVTDTIQHFCRIVKDESQRKLITVAFYGYTQDENWAIESDHRNPWELLNSDDVDAYSAPHTYHRRAPGEDGEMRQYTASTALHGRLFIDEGDDQTWLENTKPNPDNRALAPTRELTKSVLLREFGLSLTQGTGLWYMDLNGGWFRDAELLDLIGRMKPWSDRALELPRGSVAQVAVFSQPKSEMYLGYRRTPENAIGYGLYHEQMGEFFRTGAPFDWYLLDDLALLEERQKEYKVYIFLDCFYLTQTQREGIERLKRAGHTILWFFAPGYASERDLSMQRTEELTGFHLKLHDEGALSGRLCTPAGKTFGIPNRQKNLFTIISEPGIKSMALGTENLADELVCASRTYADWKSVFCTVTGLPASVLRALFREAGVHIYCDSDAVVTASAAWLMLHTREKRTHTITLPSSSDVFEITQEMEIGKGIRQFQISVPDRQTRIFLCTHREAE